MKHFKVFLLLLLSLFIISACVSKDTNEQAEYETTKKMVVDILQTDDGKKALAEIISNEEMKKQLVIESDTVKEAIDAAVVSDKSKKMWKSLFEDPEFAKIFAEAMEEEQKRMMKDLMNDPEYQEKMQDVLQDPEMVKHTVQLLKSKEFKEHLQQTVQETFENPIFQAKIQQILIKATEEKSSGEAEDSGDEKENSS